MRIAGIDVWLDPSWFISLAILSLYSWDLITQDLVHDPSPFVGVAVSVLFGFALVACILVHELAHSLIARLYGLPVRRITLFAFGGVSQIEREAEEPSAEFFIALAGPLASIVIGLVLAGVARSLYPQAERLHGAWGAMALMNLLLAVFNLIPAFPMDGGRILRSALWAGVRNRARATHWAALAGRGFAGVMMAGGVAAFVVPAALGHGAQPVAIWALLIGLFLYNAASASERTEGGDRPNVPPQP